MKHIDELIADGGEITVCTMPPHDCVASAADRHNTLAMLVRREGETLTALLKRLDKAIGKTYDSGDVINEVNANDD